MKRSRSPLLPLSLQMLLAIALASGACGTLDGSDQRATLVVEVTEALDAATLIAQTLTFRSTEVAVTAAAAATAIHQLDGINVQLAATMRAALPPTQQIVLDSGPVTPGLNAPLPGEWTPTPLPGAPVASVADSRATPAPDQPNQLTAVGPALAVRDADGCAVALQTSIPASSPRIYATTRILNATAGTSLQATWSAQGQVVFSNNSYTIPADDGDFCVWFYIEPADVNFAAGEWALQFLVNGQPTGATASFTLTP